MTHPENNSLDGDTLANSFNDNLYACPHFFCAQWKNLWRDKRQCHARNLASLSLHALYPLLKHAILIKSSNFFFLFLPIPSSRPNYTYISAGPVKYLNHKSWTAMERGSYHTFENIILATVYGISTGNLVLANCGESNNQRPSMLCVGFGGVRELSEYM